MQFVANIPYIKCYLKKEYLYDLEKGHGEFEECVLLSVKSMQGRALMFEAYLPQYGCHSDPNMIDIGPSEVPAEHKQFNIGKLNNGQFFAQPNNRMLWYEQSLTPSELKIPDFKVSTKYFFCEQDSKWVFGDSDDYFYEEVERKEYNRDTSNDPFKGTSIEGKD